MYITIPTEKKNLIVFFLSQTPFHVLSNSMSNPYNRNLTKKNYRRKSISLNSYISAQIRRGVELLNYFILAPKWISIISKLLSQIPKCVEKWECGEVVKCSRKGDRSIFNIPSKFQPLLFLSPFNSKRMPTKGQNSKGFSQIFLDSDCYSLLFFFFFFPFFWLFLKFFPYITSACLIPMPWESNLVLMAFEGNIG